jgi:hypothetical protein
MLWNRTNSQLRLRVPAWDGSGVFAAVTWKQTVTTRAEFRDRVRRAVRLICRTSG